MTTPSYDHKFYLPIIYAKPLWANAGKGGTIDVYASYSHVINALGGYWTADISFPSNRVDAEDWYENGLGRDITVQNAGLVDIWNGAVNEVEVKMGTLTAKRGPLLDVVNRVSLVYSTIDTSTSPPVLGIRETTTVNNNTVSQGLYGIIEKILSTGGATLTTAEQIRDTYLDENKDPETSQSITIGSMSEPTVTLRCAGYSQWLETFTYSSTTTGTRSYSDRIKDALGADPNSIFSTDYANIDTNGATVPRYDNDDRTAWQIIKGLVSKGDTSYNRYTFGVYGNRLVYYKVVPTSIEYYHRIGDNKQRIETASEVEVKPWDILPARWLQISDWLIGRVSPTGNLRDDPRNLFIESVRYSAPWNISINGNKINTLPQILGQLGLTGIGA